MTRRERIGTLLGFAALAAYASFHWFSLVADPPLWRWAACVAIAVAAAVGLAALHPDARTPIPALARTGVRARLEGGAIRMALAAVVAVAALVAGLMAAGAPARLVAPSGWAELRDQLDVGLAGISQIELPYEGPAVWTRLGILLAAPLALTIAAALAFWPARAATAVRRGLSLVLLVALYAVAVTWEAPGGEPARGLGLLVCMAAFLWLGRFAARRALAAAGAVLAAGLVALPAAAGVSTTDPAVNYADWRLFGAERTATFDWDHSYGPLDWPQRGTELFEARGPDSPVYWKTTVLDAFDGARWTRGDEAAISGANPLLDDLEGVSDEVVSAEEQWLERAEISILGLRSQLLVTTGITQGVEGVEDAIVADDGTTRVVGPGLVGGDRYAVSAYAPNPSARLLKRRDDRSYPTTLERYTTLLLPQGIDPSGLPAEAAPVAPLGFVTTPLRGTSRRESGLLGPGPAAQLAGTAYAPVRALAKRLTRDARGNYQAVARVQRYLLANYSYDQEVRERRDPLPAFLFRDRAGYCQQFSGAMALLLRLAGIPSRVVSGFAPGRVDDAGVFVVRDTDAHSWVEVWFPEVGWVTVDPTPGVAPARTSAGLGTGSATAATGSLNRAFDASEAPQSGRVRGGASSAGQGAEQGSSLRFRGVLTLLVLAAGGGLAFAYGRRRRLLLSPAGAEPQLRELERAMRLLGGRTGPGVTLLSMERRLAALGPDAAAYPAALRASRYRRGRPRRPGPGERRRLRRAIARATGPRGRVRALITMPPGGPKP